MNRFSHHVLALVCVSFLLAGAAPGLAEGARGTALGSHLLEGPEVSIYNIAGEMRVLEGTGPSVRVEVLPGGRDGGRLTVEETPVKGLPTLRVIYPDSRIVYRDYGFGPPNGITSDSYLGYGGSRIHVSGRGPGLEAHADIKVFVPHGKRVHLHLAVGRAWISDVQGEVSFESASSSLDVERLSGALAVQVGSGSIRVSWTKGSIAAETGSGDILIREVDGNVSVEAGSGNIELRRVGADRIAVDAGSGAIVGSEIQVLDMSADCGSGEVDLDGASAGRLSIDAGSGSVRLRLTKNIDALAVDAGSGSVRLEAPSDLSARFKIECPKRHLHIDFPVEMERGDDDVAVGRIGGGRGRIDIDAGSGRVELVRR